MSEAHNTSPAAREKKKGLGPLAWVGIGCGGIIVLAIIGFVILGAFVSKKVQEAGNNPQRFAAELIVKLNPDIELVSAEDGQQEDGKIKIRIKKSGEEISISYADLENGNFSIESDQGGMKVKANADTGKSQIEVTNEKGETSVMKTDGKTVKIDNAKGSTEITTGGKDPWASLPDWAKGFAYPNIAENLSSMKSSMGIKHINRIMAASEDSGEAIKKFYSEQLKTQGYTVETHQMVFGEATTSTLNGKKEGRVVNVTISDEAKEKSTITLLISSDQPK